MTCLVCGAQSRDPIHRPDYGRKIRVDVYLTHPFVGGTV